MYWSDDDLDCVCYLGFWTEGNEVRGYRDQCYPHPRMFSSNVTSTVSSYKTTDGEPRWVVQAPRIDEGQSQANAQRLVYMRRDIIAARF